VNYITVCLQCRELCTLSNQLWWAKRNLSVFLGENPNVRHLYHVLFIEVSENAKALLSEDGRAYLHYHMGEA
jgi:hypothetical protein